MVELLAPAGTFETFKVYNEKTKQAKAAALDYANHIHEHLESGKNLIISGDVGTGKTHLAVAMGLKFIFEKGMPILFTVFAVMLDEIRGANITGTTEYHEAINKYSNVPLLIIDDFLRGRQTQAGLDYLFQVLNNR